MQGIASRGQRTFRSKFVSRWWQCICKSNVQKQAMQRTLTLTVKLTLLKRNVNGQTLASTTALCSGVPLVANLRRTRQRSIRSEAALPETKYKDQMFRPEPSCITNSTKLHYQIPNYKDQATLPIRLEQIIRYYQRPSTRTKCFPRPFKGSLEKNSVPGALERPSATATFHTGPATCLHS